MTDKIHEYAERDTPANVHVPNNWAGLIAWASGRFGVAVVWACVACWALMYVYNDLKTLNDRVLTAFVEQTRTNGELVSTVKQMSTTLEAMNRQTRSNQ